MAKTAWGIELGTSSVKAVKLSDDRGSVTLEALSITSLSDFGLGAGGATREQAAAGALNDLRVRAGIKKGDQVFISISGQNTLGRIISLPPVSMEKVRDTIQNEARSQIPIKLEEAVWDYQVIDDPSNIDELKVNLYAAKRQAVDEIVDVCEAAGLEITGIQVAPLGIYNYIKYEMDEAISVGCVAIDIGAENTDLVVIDGQKTYVRVVPVAGNDITKALRARFKISAEDAERLKRQAAKSKDAAQVFEAMKPPLKEMVGEIYRAVGFYKSQNETANINQLVMMGNGSKLLNIQKFFEQQLQYKVHKVETPARLELSRAVDPAEVQDNIQSLTVATGLALQGLGVEGINTINLMPPERLEARAKAKLRVPVIVSGSLILAGGVLAFLLSMMGTSKVAEPTKIATDTAKLANDAKAKFNNAQKNDALSLKARSFENLGYGRVAMYQPAAGKDETPPPAVFFDIPAAQGPLLVSRAMEEAVADFASMGENKNYKVLRANFLEGQGSGTSNNPAVNTTVVRTDAVQGEGDNIYYTATREIHCEVALALRISSDPDVIRAKDKVDKDMASEKGLIITKLRALLMAQLENSEEMKLVPKDQRDNIKLNDFKLEVTYSSVGETAVKEADLRIPHVPFKKLGEDHKPTAESRTPTRSNNRYAVIKVTAILKLLPIEPPKAPEEPPKKDKK